MDTLTVALRQMEKADSPIKYIHPVAVRETDLSPEGQRDFGLGFPVCEDEADTDAPVLQSIPCLTEVGDHL